MYRGMEERIMRLVRHPPSPQQGPASRETLLEAYKPRMEAIGLGVGPALDAQLAPRVVHVAGTKGKGSTCAMVESIFRAAGLRTGLFTSPHLVRPHERVRLQGQPVSEELLQKHFDEVYDALQAKSLLPGFFSFITLLGFHIFAAQDLDIVIVEVGLGGRLDVTNLLGAPSVCAVTLLDMDHTEYLGDTIEKIAAEKAGIFKAGVPVIVSAGQDPGALQVLRETAQRVGTAPLTVVDPLDKADFKLGLAGDHQYVNAAVAVALCKATGPADLLTDDAIRIGLERCRWPGRSQREQLDDHTNVLLDGAHTPKSLACALQWARAEIDASAARGPQRVVLLFTCMHSRDPVPLFKEIKASGLRFDQVNFAPTLFPKPTHVRMKSAEEILASYDDASRKTSESSTQTSAQTDATARSPNDDTVAASPPASPAQWERVLEQVWAQTMAETVGPATAHESLQAALDAIRKDARAEHTRDDEGVRTVLLVTGSLLLVGDTMKLWDLPVA